MKSAIVLCVLSVAIMAFARPDDSKYTDRWDNLNIKEILENKKLRLVYVNCLLEKETKCPQEAKELKAHMKEALETGCEKCTDAQKKGTEEVIGYMINNDPQSWKELCDKYDPEGKYTAKYEKELKKIKESKA